MLLYAMGDLRIRERWVEDGLVEAAGGDGLLHLAVVLEAQRLRAVPAEAILAISATGYEGLPGTELPCGSSY